MNCWNCRTELIWGGDHDLEDDEFHSVVANFSCPNCQAHVEFYFPRHPEDQLDEE